MLKEHLVRYVRQVGMSLLHWVVWILSVGLLTCPSVLQAQSQGDPSWSPEDWPLVHGSWQNQRYSTLSKINTTNVHSLGGAWESQKFESGGTTRSSPVVKDGIMYVNAGARIYALNAKTGKTIWSSMFDQLPTFQGVAVGEGRIYAGLKGGKVVALDEKTGKLIWSQQIGENPPQKGESVTAAPIYANGMIFVGLANGDWALRGRVVALDANTGRELWHFFTIPSPGETGHETWPSNNDTWKIGGGGVWQAGTVDPDLGLVYFVSGNAIPPFGGEIRPGNNLFTCSVLALDIRTGKLRWYYQLVHHDVWEADLATPLILYDTELGGKHIKGLAVMRADGYLFLLDRETGKPILNVEERPVPQEPRMMTSPTQPFPIGADEVLPDCGQWQKQKLPSGFRLGCFFSPAYYDQLNLLRPFFGMRIVPMSYSPQSGYFYSTGVVFLGWRRRTDDPFMLLDLGDTGPGLGIRGTIVAIDSRTDKIVWRRDNMPSRGGGAMTSAGGLMFESEADGNFTAYDAKTGDILWQFPIGLSGGGLSSGGRGPATMYQVDGEQYVAVPAGTSIWAFKLGGVLRPTTQAQETSSSEDDDFMGPIVDTAEIETMSLDRDANQPVGGNRYYLDEYKFNPVRARVPTGTRVTWINNGKIGHTISALDGSWTTGSISPAHQGYVTFSKPGKYIYICKDHPWVYGQIIVADNISRNGIFTREQASRGKTLYFQNCSICHGEDLRGNDQAPALLGTTFISHWGATPLQDLFDRIRTTMPQNNPGSLSDQVYLDILTYLLRSNDFPSGSNQLELSSPGMKALLQSNN
jgi:quinohemoprotein ethanol dehydrogenase